MATFSEFWPPAGGRAGRSWLRRSDQLIFAAYGSWPRAPAITRNKIGSDYPLLSAIKNLQKIYKKMLDF